VNATTAATVSTMALRPGTIFKDPITPSTDVPSGFPEQFDRLVRTIKRCLNNYPKR
jgi:hypothetical protein